jgi:hypothetical protein
MNPMRNYSHSIAIEEIKMDKDEIIQFLQDKFGGNWCCEEWPPISGYGESMNWDEAKDSFIGFCSVTGDECLGVTTETIHVVSSEDQWIQVDYCDSPIKFNDKESLIKAVNESLEKIRGMYSTPDIEDIS